jgi:ubiquinol-cytochrome c reductase cytochrome c subunit
MKERPIMIAAAIAMTFMVSLPAAAKPSAENGQKLYVSTGCYQCHGYVGQGGSAGPQLAPDPMPADELRTFLRNSTKAMPSYAESILSDAAIDDIQAYLASIKPAPKAENLRLLRELK